MPDLIKGLSSRQEIEIRNPESTRPWQHVLDPLHGYLLTLQALLEGSSIDSLNFGPTDRSLTVREVVNISLGEWPTHSSELITFLKSSNGAESKSLELDSTKARSVLRWDECWNQREAIVSTNKWWKRVLSSECSPEESCEVDLEVLFSKAKK
jgi:CDP-glucose 4,6-dehydratase